MHTPLPMISTGKAEAEEEEFSTGKAECSRTGESKEEAEAALASRNG